MPKLALLCLFVSCFSFARDLSSGHAVPDRDLPASAIPRLPDHRRDVAPEDGNVIFNGERTAHFSHPFKDSVIGIRLRNAAGQDAACTGTVINGCLLTAKHCLGDDMKFYSGANINDPAQRKFLGDKSEVSTLGDSRSEDLAIVKSDRAFPKEISQPLSIIPEEEFVGTKNQSTLFAIGYGVHHTAETDDGKRTDVGIGTQRFGKLTFAGVDTETGTTNYVFNRAKTAQALAPADSGGPVFTRIGDKIQLYGVAEAGNRQPISDRFVPTEDRRAADTTDSYAVNLSKHRKWIVDTMKKMKCGEDGAEGALQKFVDDNLGKTGAKALAKWDGPDFESGTDKLIQLKAQITQMLKEKKKWNPPFDKHLTVRIAKEADGVVRMHYRARASLDDREETKAVNEARERSESFEVPMGVLEFPR